MTDDDDTQVYRSELEAELRRLHEFAESEGRWASDYLQRAVHAETEAASLRDQNTELDRRLAEMEQAGRRALEALGLVVWTNNPPVNAAIAALRERLAQPEQREVELEFKEWMHPQIGVVPVDPKTPLILKAHIREKNTT